MVAHLFSEQERKGDVGVDVEIILFPLWGVVRPICVRKEDIYENSLIFGAITKSIDAASLIQRFFIDIVVFISRQLRFLTIRNSYVHR